MKSIYLADLAAHRELLQNLNPIEKDIIRRRGENISSAEVEGVLNTHPKVMESAVVPVAVSASL